MNTGYVITGDLRAIHENVFIIIVLDIYLLSTTKKNLTFVIDLVYHNSCLVRLCMKSKIVDVHVCYINLTVSNKISIFLI